MPALPRRRRRSVRKQGGRRGKIKCREPCIPLSQAGAATHALTGNTVAMQETTEIARETIMGNYKRLLGSTMVLTELANNKPASLQAATGERKLTVQWAKRLAPYLQVEWNELVEGRSPGNPGERGLVGAFRSADPRGCKLISASSEVSSEIQPPMPVKGAYQERPTASYHCLRQPRGDVNDLYPSGRPAALCRQLGPQGTCGRARVAWHV